MKYIAAIFLLCAGMVQAMDFPIRWTLGGSPESIRIDVHEGTNLVTSRVYNSSVTNDVLRITEAGDYLVSAVALGRTTRVTNALTGEVWATNATPSVPSNILSVHIDPPPRLQMQLQSTDGLTNEWTDLGVAVGYELQNVEGKYFRLMMVQKPYIPPILPPVPEPTNSVLTFLPADDAYLQGSTRFNDGTLKVEAGRRVTYLKFAVAGLTGRVTRATLSMQENGDTGSGTLRVYRGSHSNWTESNLSTSNRPTEQAQVGTFTGPVAVAQIVSVNVTPLVTGNGTSSIIVKQDAGGNDVWFGSRESARKPKLVIETANP